MFFKKLLKTLILFSFFFFIAQKRPKFDFCGEQVNGIQAMNRLCLKIIDLPLVLFTLEMCSGQLPMVINTWPLPDATSAGDIPMMKIILNFTELY